MKKILKQMNLRIKYPNGTNITRSYCTYFPRFMKQGQIHGISGLPSPFLPAEKNALWTDPRTHGLPDGHPLV